ncbi:5-formyltetrahydrofolate cyclo-ligase [Ornithinicoccus hortensis]|uniref:5-formyltetrahydrofolate cyclo-ligase n=1 Tax=Ornithinicoccus hortensis TaxID=82346 RepID=A0A542YVN8_9MICO|nr:5-formyltetrahydrofolate cyclo-ligase [Ornithinicoccus hortensis]TQL52145.1 5-formyltetrahydrofolate cyclo-ligase [Ornithinicoccus hortensis]
MPDPSSPAQTPTPESNPVAAKTALRAQLLARRRALADGFGPDGRRELADRLATAGIDWFLRYAAASGRPDAPAGWTVTAYQSRRTEPPVEDLVDRLRARGVRVLMPITLSLESGQLDWFDVADPDSTPLARGVMAEVDVAFTPGLGVDGRGIRIGKGGGYYDRALQLLRPDTPTVTVLHEHELLPHVPDEPHDTPVWGVLTADGVHQFSSREG